MTPDDVTRIEQAFARLSRSFVRALGDAAAAQGLGREMGERITRQTVLGSIALLRATGQSPSDLVARVASKGGTTEAGLKLLDAEDGIDAIVGAALAEALRAD